MDIENKTHTTTETIIADDYAKIKETKPDCVLVYIKEQYNKDKIENNVTLSTGFEQLDLYCGGLKPELYVLGGRPSLGKSAFALQIAYQAAKKGKDVIICTNEVTKFKTTERLIKLAAFDCPKPKTKEKKEKRLPIVILMF